MMIQNMGFSRNAALIMQKIPTSAPTGQTLDKLHKEKHARIYRETARRIRRNIGVVIADVV